jgi:hypothetical protein
MKTKQKVQRHFKLNREYYYKVNNLEIARYTKVRTASGYGAIGMYGNGCINFYEDENEQYVDEILLCWLSQKPLYQAKKIIFK